MSSIIRRLTLRTPLWLSALPAWLAILMAGCVPPEPPPDAPPASASPQSAVSLREEIDEVLDMTLKLRRLNTEDHGAWQIMHGVLAYQQAFPVRLGRTGEERPALEFAMQGGPIVGWTFQPGDLLDPKTGRVGLRGVVEPGTKKGQGHPDQWLAIMSQCEIGADQTLIAGGRSFTLQDLIDQVKRDVPYNVNQEWSWTLAGLTRYLPTSAQWTAADGQTWSIERLVQAELDQNVDESACGGTHRLMGLATALKRHRNSGGKVVGVWIEASQAVQGGVSRALEYQNSDGSFSSNFFRRPGISADLGVALGSSGHILEFLAVAMTDEQLAQPQVALAARYMCALFQQTRDMALECGALYHAAHGLLLYRERVFGRPS
jgi:hypothetical protein